MSDEDDAFRLNSLHRFRKHSPRLLLQEYSHCEVPAGCGGVVLRWIDPRKGLSATLSVRTTGHSPRQWLDGEPLSSNRLELGPGPHVLAFELTELGRRGSPLHVAIGAMAAGDDRVLFTTFPDDRWRATGEAPPSTWTRPEFDASTWQELEYHDDPLAQVPDNMRWYWERLGPDGTALRVPWSRAWVRFSFTLDAGTIEHLLHGGAR